MWYDLFSLFYDRALEDLYAPYRPAAVEALRLSGGETVLDLPCGTGQSLSGLAAAVGPQGAVLGVDASRGMLRQARRRVQRLGLPQVTLHHAPAAAVDAALLHRTLGADQLDGVLCALGLTALPDWEATFARLLALVRPGGRIVLFDVYAETRTRETRSVEVVARADLSRRAWEPLFAACDDAERVELPADPKTFGGMLYVASGTKR
jgi:ubiquinone/menaquinone biosynthesis C-methylase UbiE